MVDDTKIVKPGDDEEEKKPAKRERLSPMKFEGPAYSGELLIGTEAFEVKDGEVRVPERLHAAAHQAGFR